MGTVTVLHPDQRSRLANEIDGLERARSPRNPHLADALARHANQLLELELSAAIAEGHFTSIGQLLDEDLISL